MAEDKIVTEELEVFAISEETEELIMTRMKKKAVGRGRIVRWYLESEEHTIGGSEKECWLYKTARLATS